MNPLSPLTYYLRHKRSAILQIALVGLVTTSMFLLVAVLDAIPLRANSSYLGRLSRVSPMGEALDAAVISRIQTHPGVALVIPDNGMRIAAPSLFGNVAQRLLGVSPEEAEYLMQHCDVRLAQGRMFEPRTNELVLSAEVARALDLDLGSEIEREAAPSLYREVSAPLVLVGILEGTSEPNTRLGFVSAEYLASHELYMPRSTSQLVVAWPGSKTEVDGFLETEIEDEYSRVETLDRLVRAADITRSEVFLIFGIVNSVVAVAVAFVVGVINQIAISRRLDEFGVLHALGRPRRGLIRRLTMEAAVVVGTGFLLGLAAALAILSWLKVGPFYDLGVDLSLTNPAPFCFVLPTPLVAVALTFWSVSRLFARLDAVSIVEQGSTSQESRGRESGGRTQPRLSAKALSSVTFCLRHQRRVAMMILGTSLMVLVTAFPVFFLSATLSASQPEADYLLRVSEVYSIDSSGAAAGIYGQIRSHPAVERIVPAFAMGIQMILPPIAGTEAEVYAVSETDLPVLLELYDLRLHEGRISFPLDFQ